MYLLSKNGDFQCLSISLTGPVHQVQQKPSMDSTASSPHLRHKERQGKAPLDRMKRALPATGHSFFRGIFGWKTKTNGVAKILFLPNLGPQNVSTTKP